MTSYWLVLVVAFGLVSQGCSLERGKNSLGPTIKLRQPDSHSLFDTSWMSALASPSSLSQLNCFLVNVKGDAIQSTAACGGSVQSGITDGFRAGIDSVFTPTIPISEGLIFEAYGFSGVCADAGGTVTTPPGTLLFSLGSARPTVQDLGKTIVIPVSFSGGSGLSCTTTPYQIFSDSFAYTPLGPLATRTGSPWFSGGVVDFVANGSSALNFIASASTLAANFVTANGVVVDYSKPYYSLTLDINLTGTSMAAGPGTYDIAIGLADGTSSTANSVGCMFEASCSTGANSCAAFLVKGGPKAGSIFTGSGGKVATTFALGHSITLRCDIKKPVAGTVEVIATVTDHTNSATYGPDDLGATADPCGAGCNNPYVSIGVPSGTWSAPTGSVTNFTLSTADFPQ